MNFPPNDPDNPPIYPLRPKEDFSDIAPERRKSALKEANKFFLILLISGLILGGILSFGLVKILDKLGLTEKPNHPPHFDLYRREPNPTQPNAKKI